MIKKITEPYKGLSHEVWILSLITFINRAGAMVIPFLSLYLTKHLNFTLDQVGWIMTFFGFGSVAGVWIGGKLTDKIGFYKVMYSSLFLSGIVFISLQFVQSFWGFCFGIFFLTLVADGFRPAVYVALTAYSKKENRTRSVTLIRLAINLGFSLGPALGGIIIATIGYLGLFWIDGLTCIIAAIMILLLLRQKVFIKTTKKQLKNTKSPYKDLQYLLFIVAVFLIGFTFVQYFSTIPIFYDKVMHLSEKDIGWILALNGVVIFLTEMPLVHNLDKLKKRKTSIIIIGIVFLMLSFAVLNLSDWIGFAVLGILFMTFGEMFSFPYSNSFAMERSNLGNQGEYMALYSMSFSFAFILGPNIGMHLISIFGFKITWLFMIGTLLLSILLLTRLKIIMKN